MDYVRERKNWMEGLSSQAPDVPLELEGPILDNRSMDEERRDHDDGLIPPTEEEEIDALAQAWLEQEAQSNPTPQQLYPRQQSQVNFRHAIAETTPSHQASSTYGSDEEDYDRLFMDLVSSGQEQELSHANQISGMPASTFSQNDAEQLSFNMDLT